MPRFNCIAFVQNKDDPTRTERVQVRSWCAPNPRDIYSRLDKEYSHAVAEQALPLLMSEINGLKKPEEAARKFYLMAEGACVVVQPFLDVSDTGILSMEVTTES